VYNAFNDGISIAFLHLGFKYMLFALLRNPVVDPYAANGRWRIISLIDLCINSRMLGYGNVGLAPKADDKLKGKAVPVVDSTISNPSNTAAASRLPLPESVTPSPVKPTRTRFEACMRHSQHFLTHYIVVDTLLYLLGIFGPTTIGSPTGYKGSIHQFTLDNQFHFLPSTLGIPVPTWVVVVTIELATAAVVWQGLSMGYHAFALMALGVGWEVECWEVDLFDQPWRADSVLDLWGRRWHQVRLGTLT
jgi:hypothetical protein